MNRSTRNSTFLPLLLCILTLWVFLHPSSTVLAYSSPVTEEINPLINSGDLDGARRKIQSYLDKDPRNIDAIMMMGNVLLNEYVQPRLGVSTIVNDEESIYDSRMGSLVSAWSVMVLPRDLVEEVTALWKRCLAIDNSREDIHKGICTMYARGLMTGELMDHLPRMKEALEEDGLVYIMGDYAQQIVHLGTLEDGLKVYQKIRELYPGHAGVTSDMAGMHFLYGDVRESARLIIEALAESNLDEMVLQNAAVMLSLVEKDQAAVEALRKLEKVGGSRGWMLYRALLGQLNGKEGWEKELASYGKAISPGAMASKELVPENYPPNAQSPLSAFIVSSVGVASYGQYEEAKEMEGEMWARILVTRIAARNFPERYEPQLDYADLLTGQRNFARAVTLYDGIFKKAGELKIPPEAMEGARFRYAWAIQGGGDPQRAFPVWKDLLESSDLYVRSAAAYFMGKLFLRNNDREAALEVFRKVSDRAGESKYAALCWNAVTALEDGRMPHFMNSR